MEALPGAIDLAEEGDISLEGSFIGVCIDSDDDLSTGIVKKQEHKTETLGVELSSFLQGIGFQQFKPPKLLTRHPPPAVGRDDDIRKLQEILDDILIKTDTNDYSIADKILFGPDNKIGANLLKLQESNTKYNTFLAEFPVLHLRKSKINILCSAYKDAGILHILKYMRDDEVKEWKQLITAEHIEKATRYIRRLSIALHIAFMCKFIQGKSSVEQQESIEHISQLNSIDEHWQQFDDFMKKGVRKNGTFALHYDIMNHCDEVSAIALAERLGGEQGYTLLLAVVKTSLPFSFLNGASSYAGFTTRLLHEHLKAGHFYQQMKSTLFTTPHKDSDINFAMDAQREMDHRDVLKAFRSGSNVSSVIPRMSLIDSLNEIHEVTIRQYSKEETSAKKRSRSLENLLGLTITATDKRYISRLVGLILRQGGLSTMEDSNVYNVYNQKRPSLSDAILDKHTNEIGQFLIRRFIVQTQIFGCSKTDQPDVSSVRGPDGLLQKLKQSKGVTLRRTSVKPQITGKSERQLKEDKRKKTVQKETKLIDCYSSEMNACQAIVKPDCSKPKVMKSVGMKKALNNVLSKVISTAANSDAENNADLEKAGLIFSSKKTVPKEIACSVTKATVEFAGVKFKTNAVTGKQYLKYIESSVIGRSQIMFPNLNYLAICEEKYSFTPDDFKAATRCQRKDKSQFTITHLKTPSEVLCLEKFDKASVTSTSEGKSIVSTYLARNVEKIHIKSNLTLDIDSKLHITQCECQTNTCTCARYTTPIRAVFTQQQGLQSIHLLPEIRQCKGEAEMAQLDWLFNYVKTLDEGQSCASIVTSGDIDSVVLHLFALSYLWPRSGDQNKFQHHVYVILQKTGGLLDIFNITGILEVLEREWRDNSIGIKIALALSLGGNDFLPKFHGLTHSKTLDIFMENKELRQNLFKISRDDSKVKIHFDEILYKDLVKRLYCPKNADPSNFIYDEIRQISIRPPTKRNEKTLRNPQTWLPPESAIEQLAKNVDCLIQYYLTIGQADASLPDFLKNGCLTKLCGGDIEYDLGPESHIKDISLCLAFDDSHLLERMKSHGSKRKHKDTPQKGLRRKVKHLTSTPRKVQQEKDSF